MEGVDKWGGGYSPHTSLAPGKTFYKTLTSRTALGKETGGEGGCLCPSTLYNLTMVQKLETNNCTV